MVRRSVGRKAMPPPKTSGTVRARVRGSLVLGSQGIPPGQTWVEVVVPGSLKSAPFLYTAPRDTLGLGVIKRPTLKVPCESSPSRDPRRVSEKPGKRG